MMRILHALVLMLALAVTCTQADPTAMFTDAGQAYDSGDYPRAVAAYEQILDGGHMAPELFYNLGNAYFRQGDVGRGVLNYRRAWLLSPRDAELNANLKFLQEKSGALAPSASLAGHYLSRLSFREWKITATSAYWACFMLGILYLIGGRRTYALRLAVTCGLAASLGMAGMLYWIDLRKRPEVVVVRDGAQALYAPMDTSTPHFAAPAGSILRLEEQVGNWLKVSSGHDSGWLPASACVIVYPWNRAAPT